MRGRSSVWLEHSTVTREVAGSSPVAPVGHSRLQVGFQLAHGCVVRQLMKRAVSSIALVVELVDTLL